MYRFSKQTSINSIHDSLPRKKQFFPKKTLIKSETLIIFQTEKNPSGQSSRSKQTKNFPFIINVQTEKKSRKFINKLIGNKK